MKSPTARAALLYLYLRGAEIEVAVAAGNLVEDILEIVAFCSFGLKCVALNDKKGVVQSVKDAPPGILLSF